jgi:exosortase/archaeosortase family protein
VPTDTAHSHTAARNFALRGVAWSLTFFGVLRLGWTEANVLLPLLQAQASLAAALFVLPDLPVEVTLACSGADALALCFGVIFAYPVEWRKRVAGASGGAALILGLNILRIGSLGRVVASSPAWFTALHLYIWPAVLTIAIAGYAFAWMRFADRPPSLAASAPQVPPSPIASVRHAPQPTRRFVVLTAVFLVVFSAASPLYLENPSVLALAGFIARAAASILGLVGVSAHAAANVLWTARGGFLVTQECIATPLVPVYLAGVCAYSTWRRLIVGILATLPLFIALGIARLLVVALPGALVASPLFLVHAFYQLLLGAVIVFLAALWRHGGRTAPAYALVSVVAGVLIVHFFGPLYMRTVTYVTGTAAFDDPQGAVAFLPVFQVGLYLAIWIAAFLALGWKRFLAGLAVLELTQLVGLLALHALPAHSALTVHVPEIRAWAVTGPLLIVTAVVNVGRAGR